MLGKWMLVMFFWASGHNMNVDSPSDKTMSEAFATRVECMAHQDLMTKMIEKKWPVSSTASICMSKEDFDNKVSVDQMKQAHLESSEK